MRISDWSSDVCSSDLQADPGGTGGQGEYLVGNRRESGHEHDPEPVLGKQTLYPHKRSSPTQARDPRPQRIEQVRSEEHTSELQSLMRNSYAVFCLKKKTIKQTTQDTTLSQNTTIQPE